VGWINQDEGDECLHDSIAVRGALPGKRRKILVVYATEAAARRLEGEIAVIRFAADATLVARRRQEKTRLMQ
jgi:hypothetical protein